LSDGGAPKRRGARENFPLSPSRRFCVKCTPSDSPMILVSVRYESSKNSQGVTPKERAKRECDSIFRRFSTIMSRHISKTAHFRTKVIIGQYRTVIGNHREAIKNRRWEIKLMKIRFVLCRTFSSLLVSVHGQKQTCRKIEAAMGRTDNRYSSHFQILKLTSFRIASVTRVCQLQLAFLVLRSNTISF